MLLILKAILLGIVEGLTEFLPISSTGHLIVAEKVVNFRDAARTFTIVVQLGAILAVVWYYRRDLVQRITDLFRLKPTAKKFWTSLVIATIPAGIFGLLLDKTMERYSTVVVVAIALILGGFALLMAERKNGQTTKPLTNGLDNLTTKQALAIGAAQVVSLIPGVSRSGATIVGGMFAGLNRSTAANFSFYMGMPILGLASLYKLLKAKDELSLLPGGTPALVAGVIAAFLSALLVVSWLLKYVSKHNFRIFAYYRIIFGVLLLGLLATKTL